MPTPPGMAVVVPVYNHALTVGAIVAGAQALLPVIAVNDGSTDATPGVLASIPGLDTITLERNSGKAAALKAGFARARARGFTHAITVDADGQHPVSSLSVIAALAVAHPEAVVVGVRDLRAAGAPLARRVSNALSNFWFRFETGLALPDTQCGLRAYPLQLVDSLRVRSAHYAYELELLVRAAWSGAPLIPCPFEVDYAAPTSRLSHFHPLRDFARISAAHSRLAAESLFRPRPKHDAQQ